MGKWSKLRQQILLAGSDANIPFGDVCHLLRRHGFRERTSGSHHMFSQSGVEEILNLQPRGKSAKAYQVEQVRGLILRHGFGSGSDD